MTTSLTEYNTDEDHFEEVRIRLGNSGTNAARLIRSVRQEEKRMSSLFVIQYRGQNVLVYAAGLLCGKLSFLPDEAPFA